MGTTVAELEFSKQISDLAEIADSRSWELSRLDVQEFVLSLPARDGTNFWLLVKCESFPVEPPAWHWYEPTKNQMDQPTDTPTGGGYFHSSGKICAPWNRLAYRAVDPAAPHGDWALANWQTNPKTGGTKTLAAMALRIYRELNGNQYQGRMG